MKILVTGANGLLGCTLLPHLQACGHVVLRQSRKRDAEVLADLTATDQTIAALNRVVPDIIVNLAASTNVDECERNPQCAYRANVRIVENLAKWMKQMESDCHLVQISTDQLYDGTGPHKEENITLTNYYGFSKYAGELAAASVPSTILRTNFFGRSHCAKGRSLTDWLFHSLSNSDSIKVFDDVLFSPLSMATLSEMVELIIHKKPIGVFNLGSHEGMSKADFAFTLAEELNLSTRAMTRTSTDQVTFLKTYRPKDMRMDCSKFENTLGVNLPILRDEIRQVAKEYHETT